MILLLFWRKGKLSFDEKFNYELNQIKEEITKRQLKIKFYGAIGVKLFSKIHNRSTFDIDLFAVSKQKNELVECFKSLNYFISPTKKRSDLVFFKKEPIKIKVDIEIDRFKTFDGQLDLDLLEFIEEPGIVLPSYLLLITKLVADLNDDNIYDIAHLLSEGNPDIEEFKGFLPKLGKKIPDIIEKIKKLPNLILKSRKIEKNIKLKSLKYLKMLKRSLNLT